MKKRIISLFLVSVFLFVCMPVAGAESDAVPTSSVVFVNGETVAFDSYTIGENNYFKLRDIAYSLNGTNKQFEVGYDDFSKAVTLMPNNPYTVVGGEMTGKGSGNRTPVPTSSRIYFDGKEVSFTVYLIGENNYFKLRDLLSVLDVYVEWDGLNNVIRIDTSKTYDGEIISVPVSGYDGINRDYEWYIDQGDTGPSYGSNCGPSSAVMAAKWVDSNFSKSVDEIRHEITPGSTGWWYTNNIETFFNNYDIKYSKNFKVSPEKFIEQLSNGNILLLCVNMKYISQNEDPESHYGKFYSYSDGHFLIVKGYIIGDDGNLYFEVYDPNSHGAKYEDGTIKGKDRYYLGTELITAAAEWWDYFFTVHNPENNGSSGYSVMHGKGTADAHISMAA